MEGHTLREEGVSMAPASLLGNVEASPAARTYGLGNDVAIESGMQAMEHRLTTVLESTDVDGSATDETCVDHPSGSFVESVTNPEGDP